ncbi:hypothetical protein FFZ99_19990, partial [Leptospira interrogans]
MLSKLLLKSPKLRVLVASSAPNLKFFKNQHNTLEFLNVSAGYNHENFIENLSKSLSQNLLVPISERAIN